MKTTILIIVTLILIYLTKSFIAGKTKTLDEVQQVYLVEKKQIQNGKAAVNYFFLRGKEGNLQVQVSENVYPKYNIDTYCQLFVKKDLFNGKTYQIKEDYYYTLEKISSPSNQRLGWIFSVIFILLWLALITALALHCRRQIKIRKAANPAA